MNDNINKNISRSSSKEEFNTNQKPSILMRFISYKYMWVIFLGLYFSFIIGISFSKQMSKELNKFYGGSGEGLIDTLFLIGYLLTFIIYFFLSISFLHDKVNYKHRVFHLLVLGIFLYCYFYFLGYCRYPLCMFNWLLFLPPFIIFCLAIRGTKFITIYFCLFLAFPIYVIVRDKIIARKFYKNCEFETPKPIYNPIYLPDKFFHEEVIDGETQLVPNVVEIDGNPKGEFVYLDREYYENILGNYTYIYWNCGIFKKNAFDKKDYSERFLKTNTYLLSKNITILCRDHDPWDKALTISHVKEYGNLEVISRTYALIKYTGINYSNGFSIKGSDLYCIYNKDEQIDVDKNKFPQRKKDEQLPSNYIKPLSIKTY